MSPNRQISRDERDDTRGQAKIIDKLSDGSVLWIGLIFCACYFFPFPKEYVSLCQNVTLSVGCSLIATYITTRYARYGDRLPAMEERLKRIEKQTNDICNKQSDVMLDTLRQFGIMSDQYYRSNAKNSFPGGKGKKQVEDSVRKSLDIYRIDQKFTVGKHNPVEQDYYYDLIGGSCDARNAEYFARMLSAYWNTVLTDKKALEHPEFDFVVTPKGGSPILGYEFAKLINRPFVLHEEKKRFADKEEDVRSYFNFYEVPKDGATALIVDDSTTGGRMVAETVEHLRKFGYKVNTCFVVFAPQTKDAAARLRDRNIQLISIIKTHEKREQS